MARASLQLYERRYSLFVRNVEKRMLKVGDNEARKEVSPIPLPAGHTLIDQGEEGEPDKGLPTGAFWV